MTLRASQRETLELLERWRFGGLYACDLADEFGIEVRAAQRRLDRLAATGLVSLNRSWHAASTSASITPKGRELL